VHFDRGFGNVEVARNQLVRQPMRETVQNFLLAFGERGAVALARAGSAWRW
jgi:hypothetical protein